MDYTQHSAYVPDPERHNLFVQNMRVGIYGGVLRIDLDRIGRNDWWWLNPKSNNNINGFEEYALNSSDRLKRACLLFRSNQKMASFADIRKANRIVATSKRFA